MCNHEHLSIYCSCISQRVLQTYVFILNVIVQHFGKYSYSLSGTELDEKRAIADQYCQKYSVHSADWTDRVGRL